MKTPPQALAYGLVLCGALLGMSASQGQPAVGARNPYAVKPPPPPVVVPGLNVNAGPSSIAPPAPKPSFDFAQRLVLVGFRGDTALVRQKLDAGRSTLHVLKDGKPWFFEGHDLRVRLEKGIVSNVHLLLDDQIVCVISTSAAPAVEQPSISAPGTFGAPGAPTIGIAK